jgi:carbon-monoxide dehydrogenase medium subunit
MRLPKFELLEPKTIQEACSLLAKYKEEARVIAGGTDLLVKMKYKEVKPRYLIRLKDIPRLDYIEPDGSTGIRIGALATLSALQASPLIREKFDILAQTIDQMASWQVRNLATVGGNLCNAVPSADTAPPLLVLGAKLKLASANGERVVPLEEYFVGPEKTVLNEGELLAEIQVPNPPASSGGSYIKQTTRRALDLAIVGVAAMVTLDSAKAVCQDIRIALGAVAPTPIRASKAESIIKGKGFDSALIEQAAKAAVGEAKPISDMRSSAEYRSEIVGVLTRRAISQAWEKAKST